MECVGDGSFVSCGNSLKWCCNCLIIIIKKKIFINIKYKFNNFFSNINYQIISAPLQRVTARNKATVSYAFQKEKELNLKVQLIFNHTSSSGVVKWSWRHKESDVSNFDVIKCGLPFLFNPTKYSQFFLIGSFFCADNYLMTISL